MENDIHMLSQPLLTDEGFLNEACINELAAAIKSTPRTHERLAGDSEWSKRRITHVRELTGGLAYWAVRQFAATDFDGGKAPPFAPGLERVIGYLDACIRPRFDESGYSELSLCEINKLLFEILEGLADFDAWNTEECLGKSWLDLDALLHNVCLTIRDERRKNDEFDAKFEQERKTWPVPE